jgi:hypothetical protein
MLKLVITSCIIYLYFNVDLWIFRLKLLSMCAIVRFVNGDGNYCIWIIYQQWQCSVSVCTADGICSVVTVWKDTVSIVDITVLVHCSTSVSTNHFICYSRLNTHNCEPVYVYYSHSNVFCRGLEHTDSSVIEDPTATTPQRLTPAKFSTAHIKGNGGCIILY